MPSFGGLLTWRIGIALIAFFIVMILMLGDFAMFNVRMHELMAACVDAGSSQSYWTYNPFINQKVPVLDDNAAMNAAEATWNENVSDWGQGSWTGVEPQFSLSSIKSGTPLGDEDTITGSVQLSYSPPLLDNFLAQFGDHNGVQQTITVQEQSSAQVPTQ